MINHVFEEKRFKNVTKATPKDFLGGEVSGGCFAVGTAVIDRVFEGKGVTRATLKDFSIELSLIEPQARADRAVARGCAAAMWGRLWAQEDCSPILFHDEPCLRV